MSIYRVCQNGDDWTGEVWEIDAATVADAAVKWAEDYFDNGNDPPEDNGFDLVVASPEGELSRVTVHVDWEPVFTPSSSADAPDRKTAAMLRGEVDGDGVALAGGAT